MIIIGIVVVVIIAALLYLNSNNNPNNHTPSKSNSIMSFKESNDLVGLPIITFYSNKQKLHFLLDTGSDKSAFSKELINNVSHIDLPEIKSSVTDAGGHTIEVEVAYIRFYYESKPYEGYFQIMDMTPVSEAIALTVKGKKIPIAGIIGDDFLTKYKYILDFEKMIAFSKE